jgi:hypothetical protein
MLDKPFAIFNEGQGLAIIRGNSVRPLKGPEPGTKWPMLTPTGHCEKYSKSEEAVEEGELLSLQGSANTARRHGRRHQHASQHCSVTAVGKGAPSRAYFDGEQQAFVRRARSASIALSSLNQSSVCRSIWVAPICGGMTMR